MQARIMGPYAWMCPQDKVYPRNKNLIKGMHVNGISLTCFSIQKKPYTYTLLELVAYPLNKVETR